MEMSRRYQRTAKWTILSALILLVASLSTGCITPASLAMPFMLFKEDKEEAKMPLTKEKKKEVTVVILASFANPLESRPEVQTADRELCERLAQEMKKRFDANREKIKIVPYYKVKSFLNKDPDVTLSDKREIGRHFNADYVINLEINSMTFYEGSYRQLFRGKTEIMVTVFDLKAEDGEGPVHNDIYRTEYPTQGPLDAGNESVLSFRTMFMARLARELSRWFAAYPVDERIDMR
jgi:hypothetical protein